MIEHPPRHAAQLPSASTAIGDMIARSSASAPRVSTWATRSLVPSIAASFVASGVLAVPFVPEHEE